ncbi:MAG TPA: glutathione S-transferase family protein [Pseudomonadota bacterium]|nr:glutathione S-transferase family protein [Pseudomonadota bacterium]
MVELHGFGPVLGLPDPSPFVIKVAHYLRMIDVPYEFCSSNPRKAPKGKLPFINDSGTVVADSGFILDYLRKKYKDLDAGMSAQDKALATAVRAMIEEHFYFVMVAQRWKEDRGFAVLSKAFGGLMKKSGLPGFAVPWVAALARKQIVSALHAQGTGRHTQQEVETMGIAVLEALSEFLGEKNSFLGDAPRSIDATVFGFLWLVLETPYENGVKSFAQTKGNLVAYTQRQKAQYWSDWK